MDIINQTKSIFARHGIPATVISDNGPQYSSAAYAQFASEYGFSHITSSPLYPQGNGEAERAVRTIKELLGKKEIPTWLYLHIEPHPRNAVIVQQSYLCLVDCGQQFPLLVRTSFLQYQTKQY